MLTIFNFFYYWLYKIIIFFSINSPNLKRFYLWHVLAFDAPLRPYIYTNKISNYLKMNSYDDHVQVHRISQRDRGEWMKQSLFGHHIAITLLVNGEQIDRSNSSIIVTATARLCYSAGSKSPQSYWWMASKILEWRNL